MSKNGQRVNGIMFYERFEELIKNSDLRTVKQDLCLACDISKTTFFKWLAGETTPSFENIMDIANYFKVDYHWLGALGTAPTTEERKSEAQLIAALKEAKEMVDIISKKLDGNTYEQIANEYGVSRQRIEQKLKAWMKNKAYVE